MYTVTIHPTHIHKNNKKLSWSWRDGSVVENHRLLFRRTWVRFPASAWQIITVCNPSSRAMNPFMSPVSTWLTSSAEMDAGKTLIHVTKRRKNHTSMDVFPYRFVLTRHPGDLLWMDSCVWVKVKWAGGGCVVSSRNSALFVHLLERVHVLLWRLLTLGISTDGETVVWPRHCTHFLFKIEKGEGVSIFSVLGMEPRTFHMLRKCSTTKIYRSTSNWP